MPHRTDRSESERESGPSIRELIESQGHELSRSQALDLGAIRPNLGSSLTMGGFIGGTLATIVVGSSWYFLVRRDLPLTDIVAEDSILLVFAGFLGWIVAFGFLNFGTILRDEAVYVLHWHVRSRSLFVQEVAWEQLGDPQLSPRGSQVTFFPGESLSPVLLSAKEAQALLTDARWTSRFKVPTAVARRIGLAEC